MILSLATVGLAVGALALGRRTGGDWISPVPLVAAVWLTTFALYQLFLLPYRPLGARALLLLSGSLGTLLVGIAIGTAWERRRHSNRQIPARGDVLNPDWWVTFYSLLGLGGFFWYVADVVHTFGWSVFQYGYTIRWALASGVIRGNYLFLELFCVIAPLVALAYWLGDRPLKRWTLAGPVFCFGLLWLTTDRTQFFTVALTATFMYFARYGPNPPRWRAVGVLVLAAATLTANFLIVGRWVGKIPEAKQFELHPPRPIPAGLSLAPETAVRGDVAGAIARSAETKALPAWVQKFSLIYLYASGSYPAFGALIEDPPELTGGAHTFYPVLRALDRLGLYPGILPRAVPEFRVITVGANRIEFNAYTFLYYPWKDFGVPGLFVVSGVIGILCGVVHGRLLERRASPGALVLMSQIYLALLLSFFVDKFNNTASWYIAVLSVVPFLRWRARSRVRGAPSPSEAREGGQRYSLRSATQGEK